MHWEGPGLPDFTHEACPSYVRGIQNYHMDAKGWADIAYTAVVCPHGFVFEGRWISNRTAANGTNLGNNMAYAICFLGGVGDEFTSAADRAMHDTAIHLRLHGGAGPGINAHSDWKATQCPGDEIRRRVKSGRYSSNTGLPGTPSPPAPRPSAPSGPRTLKRGMRGEDVRQWQTILRGFDSSIKPDGVFGPHTESVTKRFQKALKVTADGMVGPKTRAATDALLRWLVNMPNQGRPMLKRGARGGDVQYLQRKLGVTTDGIFGPVTERAVKNFQRRKGLVVDGIVGPKTWAALG